MQLRASTATTITVGPFVDAADGVTPETSLSAAGVDTLGIFKHAATALTDLSAIATFTHRTAGVYTLTLRDDDTDTVGRLDLVIRDDDTCLPVIASFDVIAQTDYDASHATPPRTFGTVDTAANSHTPTITEFQADDINQPAADHFTGRRIRFTAGSLAGQSTIITRYQAVGGIGQFTVLPLTAAPENNDTFVIEL